MNLGAYIWITEDGQHLTYVLSEADLEFLDSAGLRVDVNTMTWFRFDRPDAEGEPWTHSEVYALLRSRWENG